MVDEGQPAAEEAEEAEHGLLLGQPSSGAAAEPLEDEEADEESDDEAPEELTFASAQAEAREEERRVRERARRDKALLKEKRRRREELFVEQKVGGRGRRGAGGGRRRGGARPAGGGVGGPALAVGAGSPRQGAVGASPGPWAHSVWRRAAVSGVSRPVARVRGSSKSVCNRSSPALEC